MRFIYILLISFVLSACTSMVNVDYDKNIDFSLLYSYEIQQNPARISKDTRINSPFMQQRVVKEIKTALRNKGFKKLKQKAELKIKYYLDIKQEIETQNSGIAIGLGTSGYHSGVGFGFNIPVGETSSIDKLILTMDVISVKTKKLIWRGSLGYPLYEGATPETYNKLIKELVVEILKKFPPK